jgi:hypothetical protein
LKKITGIKFDLVKIFVSFLKMSKSIPDLTKKADINYYEAKRKLER